MNLRRLWSKGPQEEVAPPVCNSWKRAGASGACRYHISWIKLTLLRQQQWSLELIWFSGIAIWTAKEKGIYKWFWSPAVPKLCFRMGSFFQQKCFDCTLFSCTTMSNCCTEIIIICQEINLPTNGQRDNDLKSHIKLLCQQNLLPSPTSLNHLTRDHLLNPC